MGWAGLLGSGQWALCTGLQEDKSGGMGCPKVRLLILEWTRD